MGTYSCQVMEKESPGREKTPTDMQKRELAERFQASEHNPERWWLQQDVLYGLFLSVLSEAAVEDYTIIIQLHNSQ